MMALHSISILIGLCCLTCACAPSPQYLQGHGFYSDQYSEGEVDLAAKEGKLLEKGHFSLEASECGVYTRGLTDSRIVVPTLQSRMLFMGGNAVRHVKAVVPSADTALLGILTIPMACADWTISGDVVYVDKPPALARPSAE